jgi:hypothetical protein
LEQLNGSPVVFLAFALGETASPERSIGECEGGKTSPKAKASENKGLKCGCEKKCPLPVSGYDMILLAPPRIRDVTDLYSFLKELRFST